MIRIQETEVSVPCSLMIEITKKASSLFLRNHYKESARLSAAPGSSL